MTYPLAPSSRLRARLFEVRPDRDYAAWWNDYLRLSGRQCAYCLKRKPWAELTRDHIIPHARGGPKSALNILPCCKLCNNAKDNSSLKDFLASPKRPAPSRVTSTHPLGLVSAEGLWVWSAAAQAIQKRTYGRAITLVSEELLDINTLLHNEAREAQLARAKLALRDSKLRRRALMAWWKDYLVLSRRHCVYCLRRTAIQRAPLDFSKGPERTPDNSLVACSHCVTLRAKRPLEAFLADPLRILPARTAPVNRLGLVSAGQWVYSEEALYIQAEYQQIRQQVSLGLPLASAS